MAKKPKKHSSKLTSPKFNLDDIGTFTRRLRDRLDDPNITEYAGIGEQVKALGTVMSKCSQADALLYTTDMLKCCTIETLIDLLMSAHPKQGEIDYHWVIYAVVMTLVTLKGISDVRQKLSTILAEKWHQISEKLWSERHWEIIDGESFYFSFGMLCLEMANSALFNKSSSFNKSLDAYTMKLLAYYWKRAENPHPIGWLEKAIHIATIQVVPATTGEGPRFAKKQQFLETLWEQFADESDPPSELLKLLVKRLRSDPNDRHAPTTGGYILVCLAPLDCEPDMEHQERFMEKLVHSSHFWDRYTTAMIREFHADKNIAGVQLTPIAYLLRAVNEIQSLQQPLVLNLVESSFFDYLDEIAGQDLNRNGEGWKCLHDILFFILSALEHADAKLLEGVAGEMPRTRLLHFFAASADYDPRRRVDRTELWHLWQFQCWVPLLKIYALVMTPDQCYRRGCKNEGILRCTRCKTKYCSRECQVDDWSEHKLICEHVPKIQKMEESLELYSSLGHSPHHALLALLSPLFKFVPTDRKSVV